MNILNEIGLTPRESELYQQILKKGEVKVGVLLTTIKAHPQVIYRAVDGLTEKGLATQFYRRGRKFVKAESPEKLLKIEEKRLDRLEKVLPTLLSLQKQGKKETIVRVEKGNEAIIRLRSDAVSQLKKGDVYYLIGGSTEHFYQTMGEELERIEATRVKKGIKRKLISYESQRARIKLIDKEKKFTEFRFIEGDKSSPASTAIFGNMVGLMIWTEEPIAITLESRELADSYRDFFESLWKIAQK